VARNLCPAHYYRKLAVVVERSKANSLARVYHGTRFRRLALLAAFAAAPMAGQMGLILAWASAASAWKREAFSLRNVAASPDQAAMHRHVCDGAAAFVTILTLWAFPRRRRRPGAPGRSYLPLAGGPA